MDTFDTIIKRGSTRKFRPKQIEEMPKEEWVVVPNTHDTIISKADFEKVQGFLKRDTRTAPKGREFHLFSGFLKYADCGKAVPRSSIGKHVYYACSTSRSKTACTMHGIKHHRLEAAVLSAIQQQVHLAVSCSAIIARINSAPLKKTIFRILPPGASKILLKMRKLPGGKA